jgi:hypothetical protein
MTQHSRTHFFLIRGVGWDWDWAWAWAWAWARAHLVRRPLFGPILPPPGDRWVWCIRWDANCQGKQECSEETYPNATSSPTNRTGLDLRSNPGRRGRKPATDSLSCGVSLYDCDCIIKFTAEGRELEKLTVAKLFKKCPEIKAPRVFITVFTKARHLSLYGARWIQSSLSHFVKIHFNIILSIHVGRLSGVFRPGVF